jgi:hypothetical protein
MSTLLQKLLQDAARCTDSPFSYSLKTSSLPRIDSKNVRRYFTEGLFCEVQSRIMLKSVNLDMFFIFARMRQEQIKRIALFKQKRNVSLLNISRFFVREKRF